jgi:hypothetical protein
MSDAHTSPVLDRHETSAAETRSDAPAKALTWSAFFFALLQSICTAVLAISGIRVAIGLTALAAAAGVDAPARGFHADAIRLPMMAFALVGSLINLYLVWNARRLRNRPSAQWRRVPLTARKKASERWQLVLSIATLVLLAVEWVTHSFLHHGQ